MRLLPWKLIIIVALFTLKEPTSCRAADSLPSGTLSAATQEKAPPNLLISSESRAFAAQAEKAFTEGNLSEAEALYKKSLNFSSGNPSLLVSLAAIETRMGKLDDSEKLLQQALPMNLKNGHAWLLLGMNYLQQKRDEEAFAALVQAVLYDENNPRAHNYLGIASGRKGWSEASEEELRRAVEIDPNYADANFNLAVLYLRRTPPLIELARRHYQQALDLGAQKDPVIEAELANGVASPVSTPAPSTTLPSPAS